MRLNYNYKSRYYFTFTGRYDGSSNFAENNKWGFFPSAAVKWNAKNENFLKQVRWLDELSLRLSAGRTGNDAIATYRSLEAYGTTTNGYLFGGTQSASFFPSRVANPNLTWEKTTLYNAGLDFSAFDGRLNITVDGYYSTTRDLLLSLQTIHTTGYTSRFTNLGKTSNRGVEVSVESRNIVKPKFGWTTSFTLSHNKQMVDDIGHEEYVSCLESGGNTNYMMYGYKTGYPLNALWGFQYAGVWKTTDQFERNRFTKSYISSSTGSDAQLMLGYPKYVDQNRDGILSEEDLIYLGNSDPVLYGGLQNTFNIGGLRIGFYFSYSLGGKIYNYSEPCDGRRLRHQPVPLHARRVASRAQPGFRPAPCGNRRPTGSQFVAGARCLVPASEERHGLLYVRLAEENPPAARHHAGRHGREPLALDQVQRFRPRRFERGDQFDPAPRRHGRLSPFADVRVQHPPALLNPPDNFRRR